MKTNIKSKFIFFILIGLSILPVACKKFTTENLTLNVDTDVLSSPTLLSFSNAKSGATNQPQEFTLTISGKDKDKIVSSLGNQSFEVHDGWVALNLAKGVEPTIDNPINFTISAKINGFEDVRREITLISKDELKLDVKVIEKGNLPSGVSEEYKAYKINAGVFSSDEVLSTIQENGTNETVSLSFASGTVLLDKDKNKIIGDSVHAKVRYYDVTDESVNVFPGGLSPQNVLDKSGNQIVGGVDFFTAGMMDVDINVSGTEVKFFDKPVLAEMKINPNQDNFITGEKVKVGDSIPVWSLDETTGQWKEENKAVVALINGDLVATFKINHLSGWNLDWGWYGAEGKYYKDIFKKLDVKFTAPWINATGSYEVTLRSPNGGYLGALHGASLFNGFVATFEKTPNIPLAYIEIRDNFTNKVVSKTDLFNPSTKGYVQISLGNPPVQEYVDVSMSYTVIMSKNPKLRPNPSAWIVVTDLETYQNQYFFTGVTANKPTKGSLNIRLINGKKYRVSTRGADGKIISCESVFDIKNLKPQNIKGLDIKRLEYDQTVKKVFIDCIYTINK